MSSKSKSVPFFIAFSAYIPRDPQLCVRLAECQVLHITPGASAGSVQVSLELDPPLTKSERQTVESELSRTYGGTVTVHQPKPTVAAEAQVALSGEQDPAVLVDLLRRELGRVFAPARGLMVGATGSWEGEVLSVSLPNGGKELLSAYLPAAEKPLAQAVGRPVRVVFSGGAPAKSHRAAQLLGQAEGERLAAMKASRSVPPKKDKPSDRIYGKVSMKTVTPMADLSLELGSVLVKGDVFSVDHKELKSRNTVIRFDLTDYTGSIRVSQFMSNDDAKPIVKAIKNGQHLLIQGRLEMDRYDGDLVLRPVGILAAEKEKRRDTAPQKRVELHLHTQMSATDALTVTGDAVGRAMEWGHRAIAITDHGVAHSFPDADHAAKGDFKILYGVEAYFQNDVDSTVAVHGRADRPLEGEYVVFDIETTGFDPRKEAIIEIGAVLIKDGIIQPQHFNTFAAPQRPLSPKIVTLTGITDEMLSGAPSQSEAVRAFLDYAGDRPLVAHNADFDVSFIRQAAADMGAVFDPTTVDTLSLARRLYPELKNHKLDTVAEHLRLGNFNHHRADDDAATAAGIFLDQLRLLRIRGAKLLQDADAVLAGAKVGGQVRRSPYHLIVLAKNQTGLRNLYKLISLSHLEHFYRNPIMPKSLVNENREGLIIGSACEAGELFRAIVEGKPQEELERIAQWYDYLEIQPLSNNAYMLRPGKDGRQIAQSEEDLRDFNRKVVELGEKLGKPVCATGDVHFLDPQEEIYRHIILDSKGMGDADNPNPLYFRTTDEMLAEFAYLGQEKAQEVVVTNPNLIADWCDRMKPLPAGLFPPTIENSAQILSDLVWGRARELYGDEPPQVVVDRINAELGDILRCHYDVIYMSAQKLVQDSLDHGYLVGSRGSVGSSIVAFLSGITEVNSLPPHYRCPNCKHADFDVDGQYGCGADMPDAVCPVCGTPYEKDGFDIPFETFLGFGGDKVPDIDLNFSGEYQSSAHRYTFELFGESHVFRAGTIGTIALKTAFGYVKKYLEKRGLHATKAEENRLATGCTGVKRTTGQHPGGMVVIPQDCEIYDFCPVQHPADDTATDIITTHFEYHSMESNLLKLDMLGHDDPSMIRMLEDLTGVNARTDIRLDDPDTMSLFTTSEKLGFVDDPVLGPTGAVAIPEFNTKFTRQMLMDTQPKDFSTLVRLSGFSHGTDVWLGNARDLILNDGVSVLDTVGCRDDIMLYLIKQGMDPKAAFKIMEAVRKGKVKKGGFQPGWVEDMKAHNVPDWYIDSLAKIGYLFPKAHAVAYVMMAYRIAWFKVHRPLAFYAAYFTIRAKAFDATVMCQGMEQVKGKMKEIADKDKDATDVEQTMLVTLEVCYEFYLRGFHFEAIDLYRSDATRFLMDEEKGALLPPFISVPGLGESAAQSIVEQRQGRSFISVSEFSDACPKVSKAHIEGLKAAGAMAGMPETSQLTLFG